MARKPLAAALVAGISLLSALAPAGAQALSVSITGPPSGTVYKRFSSPRSFSLTATGDSSGCTSPYYVSVLIKSPSYNGPLIPAGSTYNESTFTSERDTADGPGVYQWAGQIRCGHQHVETEVRTFTISEQATAPAPSPAPVPANPQRPPSARDDCKLLGAAAYTMSKGDAPVERLYPSNLDTLSPKSAVGRALKAKMIKDREQVRVLKLRFRVEYTSLVHEMGAFGTTSDIGLARARMEQQQRRLGPVFALQGQAEKLRTSYGRQVDQLRKLYPRCEAGDPIAAQPHEIRLSTAEKRDFTRVADGQSRRNQSYKQVMSFVCFGATLKDNLSKGAIGEGFKRVVTKVLPGAALDHYDIPNDFCSGLSAATLAWGESIVRHARAMAADPPRGDYATSTRLPKLPRLRLPVADPRDKAAIAAWQRLLDAQIREGVLGSTLVTAIERAQGAFVGRNRKAAKAQLAAARRLAVAERRAIASRVAAEGPAIRALRKAGITMTLRADAAVEQSSQVWLGTQVPALYRSLTAQGLPPETVLRSLADVLDTSPKPGTVKFPELLRSASKDTREQLAALKKLDRRLARAIKKTR